MKLQKIISVNTLSLSVLDVATWPDLEESLLKEDSVERIKRYKLAIIYVVRDHASISASARKHGIDRSELDRALTRCLTPSIDGEIEGFRALIPYRRLQRYERRPETVAGTAGLMEALLEKYPTIEKALWKGKENGESIASLSRSLVEELLPRNNHPTHLYPYNTKSKGCEGLRLYFKRKKTINAAENWGSWGELEESHEVIRPFQQVQLDAHRCDAHFVIHLEGPDGISRTFVLERIWLLVLVDAGSRSALGYSLSFNRQCNISDVLEAIHTAIVPQPRLSLTIPGLEYRPGAALPNQVLPICAFQKFDQIFLDNAMAHRSPNFHKIINEELQCGIRMNRAGTPNDNKLVERFFGSLTAHGFQRTPSTTGNGPNDPRRQNPEEKAVYYEFTMSDAEQLLAVLIANYNVEKHRSIYTTPLDYLKKYFEQKPTLTRHVPEADRELWSLRKLWEEVTVKGCVNKNKRPFIQYKDAEYKSDLLVSSAELINTKLLLKVNLEDLRKVEAYFPDGRFFGFLHVQGRWAMSKHSMKTRQLIIRLAREKVIDIGYKDPVAALISYLEEKAKESKWARNQLARTLGEKGDDEFIAENNGEGQKLISYQPEKDDWISFRTPVYD